jgi:hypothetical protein
MLISLPATNRENVDGSLETSTMFEVVFVKVIIDRHHKLQEGETRHMRQLISNSTILQYIRSYIVHMVNDNATGSSLLNSIFFRLSISTFLQTRHIQQTTFTNIQWS